MKKYSIIGGISFIPALIIFLTDGYLGYKVLLSEQPAAGAAGQYLTSFPPSFAYCVSLVTGIIVFVVLFTFLALLLKKQWISLGVGLIAGAYSCASGYFCHGIICDAFEHGSSILLPNIVIDCAVYFFWGAICGIVVMWIYKKLLHRAKASK